MKKIIDITGKSFGKLTVIKQEYTKHHHTYWLCKCECGNEYVVRGDKIKSGHTKSCGCIRQEMKGFLGKMSKTHGATRTRLYRIWAGILSRCENPNLEKPKSGLCPVR
jgi:hypothetical protein